MRQRIKSFLTCSAIAGILVCLPPVVLKAQQAPVFDAERWLAIADADLDGRLTLDEYRDFMRSSPQIGKGVFTAEDLFRRLDFDRDRFISLGEYQRSFAERFAGPKNSSGIDTRVTEKTLPLDIAISVEQEQFFEVKIRPILNKHCSECHSNDSRHIEGGLHVDTREGLRAGGNSGQAIVTGRPEASLLYKAVRYEDSSLQMPPNGRLPPESIADIEAWIRMGAPDPRSSSSEAVKHSLPNIDKARQHWSFRPPQKVTPPTVAKTDWVRDEIDQFLLSSLEAKGLEPSVDAKRHRLLRRVYYDLIGLPPTPDELAEFLSDDSVDAFAKVVDRLLASPLYGERWGRHWLDVARYAESSGKTNFTYPQAWRFRDWVIASFNSDKPYDQFVREQIAGDLLPTNSSVQQAEQTIGTSFLALGSKSHEAEVREQFTLDVIDEQIETTTRAFLGLTVACARCHDHKLDPVSQRDYYALSGIFRSSQTCSGTLAGVFPNFNASPLIELPDDANAASAMVPLTPEKRTSMEQRLAELLAERDLIPRDQENRDQQRRNNSLLSTLRYRLLMDRPGRSPRVFTMGVRDRETPVDSNLYVRGELAQPGAVIPRGVIGFLNVDEPISISDGSGRLQLADWLASDSNPLTARVMVNRVWLHLFGRGIVATADNFGVAGATPSHPELLDALAVDFINQGWSVKRLVRRIVLSRAYHMDSRYDSQSFDVDPDNALLWRMSKRRLEAESIRDTLLFLGGNLNLNRPVGSIVSQVGEGLALFVRTIGSDATQLHRSVYLPLVRDQVPESLLLFDFADPSLVTGERGVTTGPAQSLFFMNSPLITRQADLFADRILRTDGDQLSRISLSYRMALSREPTASELQRASDFFSSFPKHGTDDPLKLTRQWTVFCQALLASAEFRYVD